MPNIIQFHLYLTKLLQKQNSSTFLWFTVYIRIKDATKKEIEKRWILDPDNFTIAFNFT